MPGTVVLDSSNLSAIIEDATGEPLEDPKEPEKPAETASEPTVEKPEGAEDPDDVEGDDGLTPRQKRELTAKMQSAIGKKHRALKEAEEFAAEQYNERRLAESRAEQYEREIKRLQAQLGQPAEKAAADDRPKRENFETEEAFREAMDDWRVEQKFRAREAEQAKAREAERQAQVIEQAKARIARALELVPDYAEVTEAADIEVPPVIAGYMQKSPMFAELGYHFAKNPDVLEGLRKLPTDEALVEIGRISATLTPFAPSVGAKASNGEKPSPANGRPAAAKPSTETGIPPSKPRAPAPITPLAEGSGRQVEKDEREMDVKEAMAAWQRKRHVNLGRRQRH